VSIPLWALVHLPVVVTVTTAAFTPRGWIHSILYVLFENAMGVVKLWAVIAGQTLWQNLRFIASPKM
jgi:beta-mannan synthase